MLWKDGTTSDGKRGYEYYRGELDQLARVFAEVMNAINIDGAQNDTTINAADKDKQYLFYNKDSKNPTGITAANISINSEWVNGNVHVSTAGSAANGTHNPNDTILNMLEAMGVTYGTGNVSNNLDKILKGVVTDYNLRDNSFADFMNHTSTVLANDSYHNAITMKTNVTVLNGIQNSRDEVSGVSLDEEASNMMQFASAYNAASRLMTALDQTLDTLINSTGVVGR